MRRTLALIALTPALLLGQAPGPKGEDRAAAQAKARRDRLLDLYRGEAAGYVVFEDAARDRKVDLQEAPVYTWTNPIRGGEQDGAVFVWTSRGRAQAIATFFSYPAAGPRNLNHELHSLATTTLQVSRPGGAHSWSPRAPGIELAPVVDAPKPAATPALRLAQIREIGRSFSATSEDLEGKRWDLRLLPQPLYRSESSDPAVLDGAVLAFVTSAGTDPEVILVIEARKAAAPGPAPAPAGPTWQYAVARFSDLRLKVRRQGSEVFAAEPIPWDAPEQDPRQRYRTFRDREIPPIEGEGR